MKKTTKELLDDLLEDGAPAEFQAALLGETMHSARRRKRVRRFNMTLSALAVAGICAFSFWKARDPGVVIVETRQAEAMVVNSQPGLALQAGQVVISKPSSIKEFVTLAPSFAEVETSGISGRYQVIQGQEALAAMSGRAAAQVHHNTGGHGTERGDGNGISQIAFKLEKARLKTQPNIRHLQCAVPRASQPPKEHKQIKGKINPAADGSNEG